MEKKRTGQNKRDKEKKRKEKKTICMHFKYYLKVVKVIFLQCKVCNTTHKLNNCYFENSFWTVASLPTDSRNQYSQQDLQKISVFLVNTGTTNNV